MSYNDSMPSARELERKEKELRKKAYLPEELVNLVVAVAGLQLEESGHVQVVMPKLAAQAQGAVTGHTPDNCLPATPLLLPRKDFPFDSKLAHRLAPKILSIIGEQAPSLAPMAHDLLAGLDKGTYSLEEACREIILEEQTTVKPVREGETQGHSCFDVWAAKHPDSPVFFRFVACSCVTPSAMAVARLLEPSQTQTWAHGSCPVCGSLPLIGRFKGPEGVRMHTCSFCQHEYRVPRIGCPFCHDSAPEREDYYASTDEPGYRINVCTACNTYIKLADFRQFDRVYYPTLDDLESLTLDLYARQMGFQRPTLSAWGF